jgi:hypothetical protein
MLGVFISLTLLGSCYSTSLFVSTKGSDTNSGTQASPFLTLTKAQEAARALIPSLKDDLFVYIQSGTYFQAATLTFTPSDGGSPTSMVHYVGSWPGETSPPAVVHSGVAVSGWSSVPGGNGLWSAPFPGGIKDTRQVYRSGVAVPPASGPGLGNGAALTQWGYTTPAANIPFFTNASQSQQDIELVYTGRGSSWTESRLRVQSVEVLPGGVANITMQQPGWSFHTRAYGQALPTPASTQNTLSTLQPGQHYANSATQTLYYSGSDPSLGDAFLVPSLEVLMEVAGVAGAGGAEPTPVRFLSFEGIQFSYATWLEPNQGVGYVDMQSGYRILSTADPSNDDLWVPVPGNIQVHTASNISFSGCLFSGLGATALTVLDSSQSVAVVNNTFQGIACAGVAVGQVSDFNTTDGLKVNAYFHVHGNLFDNIPNEFHDCPAILGGYIMGSNITHNAILNASNGGVCSGWGWSRDEATNSGWNTIAKNYVYRSNWLLEDCGSLYVLGPQPQSNMTENFLSGQVKLFGALYTDEGSAYCERENGLPSASPYQTYPPRPERERVCGPPLYTTLPTPTHLTLPTPTPPLGNITRNVVHNVPGECCFPPSLLCALIVAGSPFFLAPFFSSLPHSPPLPFSFPLEWLHIWTSSIHDESVTDNWSDQTYQDVHGTRCVVENNTFIKPGDPFPAEAQAIMAASGPEWWTGARV